MRNRLNRAVAFLMTIIMLLASIDLPVYASGIDSDTVNDTVVAAEQDAKESEEIQDETQEKNTANEKEVADEKEVSDENGDTESDIVDTSAEETADEVLPDEGTTIEEKTESSSAEVEDTEAVEQADTEETETVEQVDTEERENFSGAEKESIPASGTLGDSVIWEFSNGTLMISLKEGEDSGWAANGGEGAWKDYENVSDIKKIIVGEGITTLGGSIFEGCNGVTEVELPENLLHIQGKVFDGCNSITTLAIPENVKTITGASLLGMNGLESITVDDNNNYYIVSGNMLLKKNGEEWNTLVKYIPNALEETVSIPESIKNIDGYAFDNCNSIKKVQIKTKVSLGGAVFNSCSNLEEVEMDDICDHSSTDCFTDCNKLKKLTITNGTTLKVHIMKDLGLTSLTEVYIKAETIEGYAFVGCTALKSVELTVNSIRSYAFTGFTALENAKLSGFELEETMPKIEENAFSDATALKYLDVRGFNYIDGNAFPHGSSTSPYTKYESIKISDIGTLGDYAFSYSDSDADVELSNVSGIGTSAFCSSQLKSISMNGNFSEIGEYAFGDCTGFTKIEISNISNIGDGAFQSCDVESVVVHGKSSGWAIRNVFSYCDKLKTAEFTSVASVTGGIRNCPSLEKLTITGLESLVSELNSNAALSWGLSSLKELNLLNLKVVNAGIFNGSEKLEKIVLENIDTIGASAFYNCKALTDLTMTNVRVIGSTAFYGCKSLTDLSVPDGVQNIGSSAFADCYSLKNISIPESVNELGSATFSSCYSLESIKISGKASSKMVFKGGLFEQCNNLKKAELKNVQINGGAFSGCQVLKELIADNCVFETGSFSSLKGLEKITIKNTDSIGSSAFAYCTSLKQVTLINISSVGSSAFASCTSLEELSMTDVETIGGSAFADCSKLADIELKGVKHLNYSFPGCISVTEISIPKSLESISNGEFASLGALSAIYVDEDNSDFMAEDGILFSKDGKKLLVYPPAKEGATYTVPDSVETICDDSFANNQNLERVTIGNVKEIGRLGQAKKLSEITVVENSNGYSSLDGVLFSDNGATLHTWPAAKVYDTYVIPDSVTKIAPYSFAYVNRTGKATLKKVIIPSDSITIDTKAFYNSVLTVIVPEGIASLGDASPKPKHFCEINCGDDIAVSADEDAVVLIGAQKYYVEGGEIRVISTDQNKMLTGVKIKKTVDPQPEIYPGIKCNADGYTAFTMPAYSLTLYDAEYEVIWTGENDPCIVKINVRSPEKLKEADGFVSCFNPYAECTVSWEPEPLNGVFACDTQYKLSVTVSKKGGGSFAQGSEFYYSENGGNYNTIQNNNGVYSFTIDDFEKTEEKKVVDITLNKMPDKTEYLVGETFDPTGMILSIKYDDGSIDTIDDESDYESIFGDYKIFSSINDEYVIVGDEDVHLYIEISLGKGDPGLTVSRGNYTYGETPSELLVTHKSGNVSTTCRYKKKGADDSTYSYTEPHDAGEYTLQVSVSETANYKAAKAVTDYTIYRKEITIDNIKVPVGIVYTGEPSEPDLVVLYNGSYMLKSSDYQCSWTDNINAGTASVTVKPSESGNYSFEEQTVQFSIAKAAYGKKELSAYANAGHTGYLNIGEALPLGASAGKMTLSDPEGILNGKGKLENGRLSFSFSDSAAIGKTAVITIAVQNMPNYEAYELVVTLRVINCQHIHKELKGSKTATCTEKGYSGDTYCTDCGALTIPGQEIPIDPENHEYDEGKVTKAPTVEEEGEKTYTCKRCGYKKSEALAKLDPEEVMSVSINANELSIRIGQKVKLKAEGIPSGAKDKSLIYKSSNEKVATVDKDGNITGVWYGTADITVSSVNGKTALCKVTVIKAYEGDNEETVRISPEDMDNYVVPEKQEHKPATPQPVSAKLKDGTEINISVFVNYMNAVTYTGKAINPEKDLGVEFELQDILDKAGVSGVAPKDIFKVSYKNTNNKNSGNDTASFYAKISLVKRAKQKFSLTKDQEKNLKAILKAVNTELKQNKITYTINKASLVDLAEVKLHTKLTKDNKLMLITNGKNAGNIKGFKNVKVRYKADDNKVTKITAKTGYSYEVLDAEMRRVKIKGNTNFTGSITVIAEK